MPRLLLLILQTALTHLFLYTVQEHGKEPFYVYVQHFNFQAHIHVACIIFGECGIYLCGFSRCALCLNEFLRTKCCGEEFVIANVAFHAPEWSLKNKFCPCSWLAPVGCWQNDDDMVTKLKMRTTLLDNISDGLSEVGNSSSVDSAPSRMQIGLVSPLCKNSNVHTQGFCKMNVLRLRK